MVFRIVGKWDFASAGPVCYLAWWGEGEGCLAGLVRGTHVMLLGCCPHDLRALVRAGSVLGGRFMRRGRELWMEGISDLLLGLDPAGEWLSAPQKEALPGLGRTLAQASGAPECHFADLGKRYRLVSEKALDRVRRCCGAGRGAPLAAEGGVTVWVHGRETAGWGRRCQP